MILVSYFTWGRRPRLRRTPWSGWCVCFHAEADEGVGRRPGGLPHFGPFFRAFLTHREAQSRQLFLLVFVF